MIKSPTIQERFVKVILHISLQERRNLAEDLAILCKELKVEEDLTLDRRKLTWSKNGPARKTVEERNKHQYQLSWRYAGPARASLEEAAKLVNKKPETLKSIIATKGKFVWFDESDGDIVTITRVPLIRDPNPTPSTEQ